MLRPDMIRKIWTIGFLALAAFELAGAFTLSFPGASDTRILLADVGAVGLRVGVASNEYNTLAAELRSKAAALQGEEQALSFRAAELAAREKELAARDTAALNAAVAALGLLIVIIAVDAYLDYRARRREREIIPAVV